MSPPWRNRLIAPGLCAFLLGLLAASGSTEPLRLDPNALPSGEQLPPPVPSADALRLERLLAEAQGNDPLRATREGRRTWKAMRAFYETRRYEPAWSDGRGGFPYAPALFQELREAEAHGLDSRQYPVDEVEAAVGLGEVHPQDRASLDLRLSHLFFIYAGHLALGRVHPADLELNWHLPPRDVDLAVALARGLNTGRVREILMTLEPAHGNYRALRRMLERHREIAERGGWPDLGGIPPKFRAELGDSLSELQQIREYLRATGELPIGPLGPDPDVLDPQLEAGIARFQERHACGVDGIIGPLTLAHMKVPVEERIRMIELAMERWRWFPDLLPDHHIMVNIPQYELSVMEGADEALRMRVIIGTSEDETPAFTDEMIYFEINPRWNVPESIATEEILPKLLEDPDYLKSKNFKVIDRSTGDEVDPDSTYWSSVNPDSMRVRFRQDSGPTNSLGTLKFIFPNPHAVYLHGTPQRELFRRYRRAFSHGCVRVERPVDLAVYLLNGREGWSAEVIEEKITEGERERVNLDTPLPVFLVYWTAFPRKDGSTGFCTDVYGHDATLDEALSLYTSPLMVPPILAEDAAGTPRDPGRE